MAIPSTELARVRDKLAEAGHEIIGRLSAQGIEINTAIGLSTAGKWVDALREKAANTPHQLGHK